MGRRGSLYYVKAAPPVDVNKNTMWFINPCVWTTYILLLFLHLAPRPLCLRLLPRGHLDRRQPRPLRRKKINRPCEPQCGSSKLLVRNSYIVSEMYGIDCCGSCCGLSSPSTHRLWLQSPRELPLRVPAA
ncbi:unnamed protein product [Urochloa humidicola]